MSRWFQTDISFQSRLNFQCVFGFFWWVRWFTPSCTLPGRLVITSCPDFHGKVPKQATSALLWAVPASGEVPFGWSTGANSSCNDNNNNNNSNKPGKQLWIWSWFAQMYPASTGSSMDYNDYNCDADLGWFLHVFTVLLIEKCDEMFSF